MKQRGASAVEFAITLPVLLLLIVGTIDFALWTRTSHRLARAVHDGARVGVATLTEDPAKDPQPIISATETAILDAATLVGLDAESMEVTATWEIDGDDIAWVRVVARVPYSPLVGFDTPFQQDVVKRFSFVPKEQPRL